MTLDAAERLTDEEKRSLLRADPVTVVRYFDNRIRLLWRLLRSPDPDSVFGACHPMIHYYYRVEFQLRGAPHIHSLPFLANAPQFSGDKRTECASFIDKLISAKRHNSSVDD